MHPHFSPLAALPAFDGPPTVGFYWVGRVLGHRGSDTALADYLNLLIAQAGFPRPLPHRKHGGGLTSAVAARSEWLRPAVLAWLHDYLPPEAAALALAASEADAADQMDAAAANLCRPLRLVAGKDVAR